MITTNKKTSFWLTFTGILVCLIFAVTLFGPSHRAVAQDNSNPSGNPATGQATNNKDQGVSCAVEKIGWIVCPIAEGASDMADKAFNMLAGSFLEVDAELFSNDPKGTKLAWEQARNLANVMFIVAFLVIIYSQVTGAGLNNYGIKRMLPRLIVAAIAVNISYYICQALVDFSNILGYEIKRALDDIANQLGPSVMGQSATQDVNTQTSGGLLKYVTYAALVVAGVVWFFLPIGGSIIGLVFITCIVIVLLLLLRKAIIVLLVVVSPIAFVMYLLPNTENLFTKWRTMFWKLLMVFPIVAALFGGGHLASTIILVAGTNQTSQATTSDQTEQCVSAAEKRTSEQREEAGYNVIPCEGTVPVGDRQAGWSIALVAMAVAVAPLLTLKAVLDGAFAAAGAIVGKIASNVQRGTTKGVGGAGEIGKWGKDKAKNSTVGQMLARNKKNREIDIRAGTYHEGKTGRFRNFNPRNLRSRMNSRLNNIGDEDGNFAERQLGQYSAQRRRMQGKEEAEFIRGKAQDWIANGQYDAELTKALGVLADPSSNAGARRQAEQNIKIARMAIGSQEGRAGLEIADARIAGTANPHNSGAITRAANAQVHADAQMQRQQQVQAQALAGALAPHLGGGGGSSPAPTPNSTNRQAFGASGRVAPGANGQAFRRAQSSGAAGMSNADLIAAAQEASRGASGGSTQHEEVGEAIYREMQNRYNQGDRSMDPTRHF